MTEPSWSGPDRRQHGTRRRYQAGCTCLLCKAAEATYRQQLRLLHAKGKQPLGTHITAKEAGAIIRALLVERYRRRQILAATGLEYHTLPRLNASSRCRLATVLRLRRAARILLGDPSRLNSLNLESDATRRRSTE